MIGALCKKLGGVAAFLMLTASAAGPALAGALKIEEVQSKGGIKAWLVHDDKLPLISMQFAFRGGVEQDPAGKEGLATLTMDLLTQGAGAYDAVAFQDALAGSSIRMNFDAGRDFLSGAIKTLVSTRAKAFELLHAALTAPRFDADALERVRGQMIAENKSQMDDPAWQARYALYEQVFGDHPYGKRSLGSLATLAGLTADDARAFAQKHLAKDNLIVAVAGAISPDELAVVLDEVFGALPAKATLTPVADFGWVDPPPVILARRAGTQTNMFFARPAPRRSNPDWFASEVANYILGGGGFSARLMQTVREKEGLTYGIGTDLASMDHGALLVGMAATDDPKAGRAYELTRAVWQDLFDKGPTDAEVDAAKAYLIGSMPLRLTTTSAIASALVGLQVEYLPPDYFEKKKEALAAVTPDDVRRVLKAWYNPAQAAWAFVGAPEGVTPTMEKSLVHE